MEKTGIKKKIEETCEEIKSNSVDKELADKLIDNLLSIKGQYDVEPALVHVPLEHVEKEYDNNSVKIVRCKNCIVYHEKAGKDIIVWPRKKGEYEFLKYILSLKDAYDTLSDEERDIYNALYFSYNMINNVVTAAVVYDEELVEATKWSCEFIEKVYGRINNQELQEETPGEDAEFFNKIEAEEEVTKNVKCK